MEMTLSKCCLNTPTIEWDFENPPFDAADFALSLTEIMYKRGGVGLAANQCGYNFRVFAMRGSPESFVIFNPRVVNVSDTTIELQEGCLSYPGLSFKIIRPRDCRLRFKAPNGETYTKQFTGMTSRIVQHEIDHLNNVPMWNHISRLKFDMAVKKASKKGFDYSDLPYRGSF